MTTPLTGVGRYSPRFSIPGSGSTSNERNLGLQGNWNRCLALARGEYMTLLPGDDVLYPDATDKRIAVLEHADNADLALAFSARDVISAGGRRNSARALRS